MKTTMYTRRLWHLTSGIGASMHLLPLGGEGIWKRNKLPTVWKIDVKRNETMRITVERDARFRSHRRSLLGKSRRRPIEKCIIVQGNVDKFDGINCGCSYGSRCCYSGCCGRRGVGHDGSLFKDSQWRLAIPRDGHSLTSRSTVEHLMPETAQPATEASQTKRNARTPCQDTIGRGTLGTRSPTRRLVTVDSRRRRWRSNRSRVDQSATGRTHPHYVGHRFGVLQLVVFALLPWNNASVAAN